MCARMICADVGLLCAQNSEACCKAILLVWHTVWYRLTLNRIPHLRTVYHAPLRICSHLVQFYASAQTGARIIEQSGRSLSKIS